MAKKKNNKPWTKRPKGGNKKRGKDHFFSLPEEIKKLLLAILMFLFSIVFGLSFFDLAGITGRFLKNIFALLVGKTVFLFPLIFLLSGLSFLYSKKKHILPSLLLGSCLIAIGLSSILELLTPGAGQGGYLGYLGTISARLFGPWVSQIIFGAFVLAGGIIFWQILSPTITRKEKEPQVQKKETEEKKPIIKRIFTSRPPKLELKEIEAPPRLPAIEAKKPPEELKIKPLIESKALLYHPPPLTLLEKESEIPQSGDIKANSLIIKKTLQDFGVPVEMGEANVGPTVTQYTLKPADGVKLSKITGLANNLSLSLASHPIRIEAPIPGRSLVGIEVPNKYRARIRLRDLISSQEFQRSSPLTIVLGRDVAGTPLYADLSRMPHLLIAGSTGSGKTLFLNSLILSLIYHPATNLNPFGASPEILRFILVDPKRVEFPVYNDLPHLLFPVICKPDLTVNALRWTISEMERRFDILSEARARDIIGYNKLVARKKRLEPLPYIVLIIDELADLMAAKGKEMEAGIVRIAQMARAVGIHLVLATQRPSVEVITGLIKTNITSRIALQVASQVDSRTILDMAGAEKLLGRGDMLFISAETSKPKRIQAPYISEKEVKRVVEYTKLNVKSPKWQVPEEELTEVSSLPELTRISSPQESTEAEDPLYEEAKKTVLESKRASASLLQRRLRIGYARAARLLDMLEEEGIVGPARGAKPRE
ncbi:DNA translocase FtsK, partial [bacterium]|nr:DNA translocase FtsK [bacterium]